MLLAATSLVAQQPRPMPPLAPGTSTIRGRVIDSLTKAPVAGCTLRATAAGGQATRVTDLAGAYELKDIAAGNYFFILECPGYLRSCHPTSNADGAPPCGSVDVVRDQQRDNVDIRVIPGAIARGQVMTLDGEPVTRASVRLGRGMKGEPTFMVVRAANTDTEGRFELTNIPTIDDITVSVLRESPRFARAAPMSPASAWPSSPTPPPRRPSSCADGSKRYD